ncbi:MAG: hypothetical protein WC294_09725 [Methanoregula sp.]
MAQGLAIERTLWQAGEGCRKKGFSSAHGLPVLERDHPVKIFRMPRFVGDHDNGLAGIPVQVPEQFKDLPRCCGIEVCAGFVGKQYPWLVQFFRILLLGMLLQEKKSW